MPRPLLSLASALALVLTFLIPLTQTPAAAAQPAVDVKRITAADDPGVAAAVSARYPVGQETVLVVALDAYSDAMVAASTAATIEAPVLFVETESIPASTATALERLRPERVVVVGGPARVSDALVRQLSRYASASVERVSGKNRYVTAAALAKRFATGTERAYVAGGHGYADAMAGAALAGHEGMPLLLTPADRLDPATATQLKRLAPDEIVVLGGPRVVSHAVKRELARHTDGTTRRLAGADRYETAAQIAREFRAGAESVYVSNGGTYPGSLVAAALAGREGHPLLLARPGSVPASTQTAIEHHEPEVIYAVGTRDDITSSLIDELEGTDSAPPAQSCQGTPSTDTKFGVTLSPGDRTPAEAISDHDAAFGEVPVVRDFSPGLPRAWDSPRARALSDRDVVISFKAPPTEVVAGKHDAFFRNWFATAPEDQTIYWSYFHEPEVKVKSGLFTTDQYLAAWRHLDELADEVCKPNMFPTLILTRWTTHPSSGRDWRDYDPGKDVVEVIAFDPYNALHDPEATTYASADSLLGPIVDVMETDGRPWGVAELGSRVVVGDDGRKRAAWLTDLGKYLVEHDASFVTYFNTTYKDVDFALDDEPSRAAWSKLVRR